MRRELSLRCRSGVLIWLLVPFLVAPVRAGIAQESVTIEPGMRLRVTAPNLGIIKAQARLAAVRSDTLILEHASPALPRAVPIQSLKLLELSTGRRSAAAMGALIGLGAGAAGGIIVFEAFCREQDCTTGEALAVGGLGGLALAGVGAAIGAVIRVERWHSVPLDRVVFTAGPLGFGHGMTRMTLRF